MDKNSVADALRALATSEVRSETARLRDVFPEVEAALAAGAKRSAILETLHKQGFTMTEKSFESALYRLRKERKDSQGTKTSVEIPMRVHASESPTTTTTRPAAAPQVETPKENDQEAKAEPEDLTHLTAKERRERRADQFIKPTYTNPLLKTLKKEQDK